MTQLFTGTAPAGCGTTDAAHGTGDVPGHQPGLIPPTDEGPIEQRPEQPDLQHMMETIKDQDARIAVQYRHILRLDAQVTSQQMMLEALQDNVNALLASAQMRPQLIGGRLPDCSQITRLTVQIFHSPELRGNDLKGNTEWTLRLTVWINGLRAAEEIKCVRLYSPRRFAESVRSLKGDVPNDTKSFADHVTDCDDDDMFAGMLRAKTFRKGTPYIRDQFCVLQLHADEPIVFLSIGETPLKVTGFRPAAGTKQGHAKWWADWNP